MIEKFLEFCHVCVLALLVRGDANYEQRELVLGYFENKQECREQIPVIVKNFRAQFWTVRLISLECRGKKTRDFVVSKEFFIN